MQTERLSQDAVPAVRAAVVRHWADHRVAGFTPRLQEMADADPDLTTRALARAYLEMADKPRQPADFPALGLAQR